MKFTEFETIWNDICTYYNKPDYRNDKGMIEIYFNAMKYVNSDFQQFRQAICNKCQYFPKVMQIEEIRKNIIDEMLQNPSIDINKPVCECKLCRGTGYRIIMDEKMCEYALACDCHNGDNKLYDGRTIQDFKHRSEYVVPRYSQVFPESIREGAYE